MARAWRRHGVSNTATCRYCAKPIEWAIVHDSGRAMPLDPNPAADGNVYELPGRDHAGRRLVKVLKRGEEPPTEVVRYRSHMQTCPRRPTVPRKGARGTPALPGME